MTNQLVEKLKMISGGPGFEQHGGLETIEPLCQRALLPIQILLGVQRPNEYIGSKRRKVTDAYKEHGAMNVLTQFPPIICEVFQERTGISTFFIVDGHHRIRYAPKFGVSLIPCLVISSINLAGILDANHDILCQEYFDLATTATNKFYEVMGIKQKRPPSMMVRFGDGKRLTERGSLNGEFLDLNNIQHVIVSSS